MPDRVIGSRDQSSDEWRWLPVPYEQAKPDTPRRDPRRNLLLAAFGAGLIVTGVVLLVAFVGDSASEPGPPPSAGPATATGGGGGTKTAGASATTRPTATETPPAGSAPPIRDSRIFVWDRQDQQWLDSDDVNDLPGYAEGEVVPFMLQLLGTEEGSVYRVVIEYQCRTASGAAFDYLASISDETDSAAHMTAPGPVRREDASIPMPDDPSIASDQPGRVRTWDASFESVAEGPTPAEPCQSTKRVAVSLLAQGPNPFLMWGGHLASANDWGQGQGAAGQSAPIYLTVSINGSEAKELRVALSTITG
jgi:hypothetical protein